MPRGFKLASVSAAFIILTGMAPAPQPGAAQQRRARPQQSNPEIANPRSTRAVDMFLKIEGVEGESMGEGHRDWIEVLSFSWSPSTGSSARLAEPQGEGPGSLTLVKRIDKASPDLTEACTTGRSLGRVVVHRRAPGQGGGGYNEYVMDEVRVRGCGQTGGDDRPTETLSLYYNKIAFTPSRVTPRPAIQGRQTAR